MGWAWRHGSERGGGTSSYEAFGMRRDMSVEERTERLRRLRAEFPSVYEVYQAFCDGSMRVKQGSLKKKLETTSTTSTTSTCVMS